MEPKDREIKFDSKQILNTIPFFISNADWVKPEQMQAVFSVVNDPAINSLMNLDNKIESSHPMRIDTSKCDDSMPPDKLVWIEMSEDEARRDFEKRYQRDCKLAINGYHLRKDNLKGWQKDLEDALRLVNEDVNNLWIPIVDQACNYQQASVDNPKNSQRYKDLVFLLKWCVGIQKIIGQNPSVVEIAEWKKQTGFDILKNGHIRFAGDTVEFLAYCRKNNIYIPNLKEVSESVETLYNGEYKLRGKRVWEKAHDRVFLS